MKRVKVAFLAPNEFARKDFEWVVKGIAEIESYEEKSISKEENVLSAHSTDELLDGGFDFANGIWLAGKGFFKMSKWAAIVIFTGLRYMWKEGLGKKEGKDGKTAKK